MAEKDLRTLVDFMYHGELEVMMIELFISISTKTQVISLKEFRWTVTKNDALDIGNTQMMLMNHALGQLQVNMVDEMADCLP